MAILCSQHVAARLARVGIAVLAMTAIASAASDLGHAEQAVEAGRRALDQSPAAPWYDDEADDYRPAQVPPPPAPSNFNPWLADLLLWMGWLALAVVLAALAYLLIRAYLLRETSEAEVIDDSQRQRAAIARVEELPVALATAPDNYLAEARRLYAAGDIAQAIIYLFSHQLLQLDRRHWIHLVKGKTNRQYLREVRHSAAPAAGELAELLERTMLVFEEIYFGKRLPSRQHIEHCWRQIDRFESLVDQQAERAA